MPDSSAANASTTLETEQGYQAELQQAKRAKTAGRVAETGGQAAQATGKGMQAAGTGMQVAGKGVQLAGKGVQAAGSGISAAGGALSSTGVGAIVGVPLQALGGGTKVAGKGVEVAGKGVEAAGKGVNKAGKAVDRAGSAARQAGQGARQQGGWKENLMRARQLALRRPQQRPGGPPKLMPPIPGMPQQQKQQQGGKQGGGMVPGMPSLREMTQQAKNEKGANPLEGGKGALGAGLEKIAQATKMVGIGVVRAMWSAIFISFGHSIWVINWVFFIGFATRLVFQKSFFPEMGEEWLPPIPTGGSKAAGAARKIVLYLFKIADFFAIFFITLIVGAFDLVIIVIIVLAIYAVSEGTKWLKSSMGL